MLVAAATAQHDPPRRPFFRSLFSSAGSVRQNLTALSAGARPQGLKSLCEKLLVLYQAPPLRPSHERAAARISLLSKTLLGKPCLATANMARPICSVVRT
jgi:hypothetical protein